MGLKLYMAPHLVPVDSYRNPDIKGLIEGKWPFVISMPKPLERCLLSEKRRLSDGHPVREHVAYSDAAGEYHYVHGNILVDHGNGLSYFAKTGSREFEICEGVTGPRDYDKMTSSTLFFDFDGLFEELVEFYSKCGFKFPGSGI
jgi:hypothetical protein